MSQSNRSVVVTGGARGLGLGIARGFLAAGAHVVIADLDAEAGEAAANALSGQGASVTFQHLDVRDPEASRALVEHIVAVRSGLDVWVNAARVGALGPAETMSPALWHAATAVILSGSFYCCQAAGRQMLKQGRGVIVNVSTVLGYTPIEGKVVTAASDAGLVALTQALGIEWAPHCVRVVGVAVGAARDLLEMSGEAGNPAEAYIRRTPLRRLAASDEIADAVLYLASDEAAYITAETLRVDGGWVAYQLF